MNRPDLNEFPSTDSRTYKLLIKVVYEDYDWKKFAIGQAKYIDQVEKDLRSIDHAECCTCRMCAPDMPKNKEL